jgi:hypothetical protein
LNVFARGRDRDAIIVGILEELASWPGSMKNLTSPQRVVLSAQISSLIAQITQELHQAEQAVDVNRP